jgi:hypothetical protein
MLIYCTTCATLKEKSEFSEHYANRKSSQCRTCRSIWNKTHKEIHNASSRKWYQNNKDKHRKYNTEWSKNNKDKVLKYRRKSVYGVTDEQYQQILIDQDNKCAFCQVPYEQSFHIDHDHAITDRIVVRWILCGTCNSMLGFSKDNYKTLLCASIKLKEYLNANNSA